MSHKLMNPTPQKEESRRFSAHYREQTSDFSPPCSHHSSRSPQSPPYHKARAHHNQQASHSFHDVDHYLYNFMQMALGKRFWGVHQGCWRTSTSKRSRNHQKTQRGYRNKRHHLEEIRSIREWGETFRHSTCRNLRKIFWGVFCIRQGILNERNPRPILSGNSQVFIGGRLRAR